MSQAALVWNFQALGNPYNEGNCYIMIYMCIYVTSIWLCPTSGGAHSGEGDNLKLWLVLLFQKGWNLCLFTISTDGSVSSGRELALSYATFLKVLKLAVTKREGHPLFFQLFTRDLFSCIIKKKSRSFWHHYTSLHYTVVAYTKWYTGRTKKCPFSSQFDLQSDIFFLHPVVSYNELYIIKKNIYICIWGLGLKNPLL